MYALEEIGYVIANDVKPLPDEIKMGEKDHLIFDFTGYITGVIDCRREKIKGHTKIYLKEEGMCHMSTQFGPPYVKGYIRIVFAGEIENMKHEELQQDIVNIKKKIPEILKTEIEF